MLKCICVCAYAWEIRSFCFAASKITYSWSRHRTNDNMHVYEEKTNAQQVFWIQFTVISTVNCERVYYSCWHFSFATCCIPPNNYFLDLMPMVEGFFMIITNSNQLHWFSHFGPFFSLPRLLFSYLKVISRHTFDRVYANPCNKGMAELCAFIERNLFSRGTTKGAWFDDGTFSFRIR